MEETCKRCQRWGRGQILSKFSQRSLWMPPFLKVSKTGDRSRPQGLSEHAIVKVWRQLLSTLENYIIKGLVNKIKSF